MYVAQSILIRKRMVMFGQAVLRMWYVYDKFYVDVNTYIHTHTHIHTDIHTYIHTYIHSHTHSHAYMYIPTYITCTHAFIHKK